jgi:hypothetical protein
MELPHERELADFWLRQHLEHAIPELRRKDLTDDVRVGALRRWLHRTVCAADEETVLHRAGHDHYRMPPALLLWCSLTHSAGCFCDGAAELARKLYELFGWRACLFDMGQPAVHATHATTLVEIIHNGHPRVTVQDTYFGFTLRYTDGSLVDFADLQARLARGDTSGIHLASDQDFKWLLYGPRKSVEGTLRHYGFHCQEIVRRPHLQAALAEWHLPGFLRGEPRYTDFLQRHHGSDHPLWLFQWPIHVTANPLGREIEFFLPGHSAVA